MESANILPASLKWTCTSCGKEFGYERCQHDGGKCIRCAKYRSKEQIEAYHLEYAMKVRKALEKERFYHDLKCPNCASGESVIQTAFSPSKITVECLHCKTIIHEEKRKMVEKTCIQCGRKYMDTVYDEPEYWTLAHESSCVLHGVDVTEAVRVKVKNIGNMAVEPNRSDEIENCLVRYHVCRLYDEPASVKKAVLEWLKRDLKSK